MVCCNKQILTNIYDHFIKNLTNDFKQRFPMKQFLLNINCSEKVFVNDIVRCELSKLKIIYNDLWKINESKNYLVHTYTLFLAIQFIFLY
jgi:hypothetical protein